MKNIDRWFILMGAAYGLLAMLLGLRMGMVQDLTHVPVHAHMNLVGWASMALFGLIYKAYPKLGTNILAKLHFILMAIAAPVMFVGIAILHTGGSPVPVVAASIVVIVAMALFVTNLVRNT